MSKFTFEGLVQQYDIYWDYEFTDGNPCHLYIVSYSEETNSWFGDQRVSDTPTSDFDFSTEMSAQNVHKCVSLIPMNRLPRKYLELKFQDMKKENKRLKKELNSLVDKTGEEQHASI